MLLNSKISSMPCLSRQNASYMNDIKDVLKNQVQSSLINLRSQQSTTVLQYFNTRVTQRLHHYRSMKREWQEIATFIRNNSFLSPKYDYTTSLQNISTLEQHKRKPLPMITPKSNIVSKSCQFNSSVVIGSTEKENNDNHSVKTDPLHNRIQQDLITLRKLIKTKQRKTVGDNAFKAYKRSKRLQASTSINATIDDQENNSRTTLKKLASSRKIKQLDRVKISGRKMHHSTLQKHDSIDSRMTSTSNSSSTCSQHSRQQQTKRKGHSKASNSIYSRQNPYSASCPSDSLTFHESHESNGKSLTSSKKTQRTLSKTLLLSSSSIAQLPQLINKGQPSFIKQEILLPAIRQLPDSEELATDRYTYAASTSSASPHSTMLKRNASLLPLVLHSTSCIGVQSRAICSKMPQYDIDDDKEDQEETITTSNDDDSSYYHLLDYKNLLNGLPEPVISIQPYCGQDDYGILFEQIDHIRETMPDSNVYDYYARTV